MAEVFRVARNGYGQGLSPGLANGRGACYWRVGRREKRVKYGVDVWGFLAVEPREFTPCVEDHGYVLWGRANGERDC